MRFFIERQLIKGTFFQLCVVGAVIGLISLFGGLLLVLPGRTSETAADAVWWAFLRLTDPGYLGDDEGAWPRLISTILTVSGYVLFMGSLVAIMTQALNRKMRELESGLTPVTIRNHIAVLGWTNRTMPTIVELIHSTGRVARFLRRHKSSRLRIVVLAEEVDRLLLQQMQAEPGIGKKASHIVLRSGSALQAGHLRRVNVAQAAAVIVPGHPPTPAGALSSDLEVIKTLLSLQAGAMDSRTENRPYVVAELQESQKVQVARSAYSGPLEVISGDAVISRLIAQNIRHPGLSGVYNALLTRNMQHDLYVRDYPALTGRNIAEARRHIPGAIVLGLISPDNQPHLNAPAETIIGAEDKLILLATDYASTNTSRPTAAAPAAKPAFAPGDYPKEPPTTSLKHILLLGWNRRVPDLLRELGTYAGEQFDLHIVSQAPVAQREKAITDSGAAMSNVSCRHLESDYIVELTQGRIQPQDYDNILLLSSDRIDSTEEADARAIVGHLLLDKICTKARRRPGILLELADPGNGHMIHTTSTEVLVGPVIVSHLLAQIALRRELRAVYESLFTAEGADILFRDVEAYGLDNTTLPFLAVEQHVISCGDTVIGIYDRLAATLQLNPPRNKSIALKQNHALVVLTTP